MIYAYARVSNDGQSLDAQMKQLRAAGAEKVFRETAIGAKTDRAQLAGVLAQMRRQSELDRQVEGTLNGGSDLSMLQTCRSWSSCDCSLTDRSGPAGWHTSP